MKVNSNPINNDIPINPSTPLQKKTGGQGDKTFNPQELAAIVSANIAEKKSRRNTIIPPKRINANIVSNQPDKNFVQNNIPAAKKMSQEKAAKAEKTETLKPKISDKSMTDEDIYLFLNPNENKIDRYEKAIQEIFKDMTTEEMKADFETLSEPTYYSVNDDDILAAIYVPAEIENSGITVVTKERLGAGSGGDIFLGRNVDGAKSTLIAFKRVNPKMLEISKNEIEITQLITKSHSERLIKGTPVDCELKIGNRSVPTMGYILEYVDGDNFESLLKDLSKAKQPINFLETFGIFSSSIEDEPSQIFKAKKNLALETAESLKVVHDLGIVHGDIKPANFLVSKEGQVKLCDWGSASKVGESDSLGICTPHYSPPEENLSEARTAVDIWSFGCMLAEVFHGPDFGDYWYSYKIDNVNDIEENIDKFENQKAAMFKGEGPHEKIDALIQQCLSFNPDDRPDINEIIKQLNQA